MLKRKIEQTLLEWKNTANRKPLIVKGCRQCGKTFSVLDFAHKNYKNVVYLNFFENPDYASVFAGSLEVDNIVMMLTALLGSTAVFEAGETVLVLDEIQDCPEARTALKFFRIDGRYDVIGTGSLLGVKGYGKEPKSIPVGSETVVDMYPLDFEEFLWANGITDGIIDMLKKNMDTESPVPEALHNRMRQLLLQYTVVGGMPDAVQTFVDTKRMDEVLQIQRDIVRSYEDDMVKYAERKDKSKSVSNRYLSNSVRKTKNSSILWSKKAPPLPDMLAACSGSRMRELFLVATISPLRSCLWMAMQKKIVLKFICVTAAYLSVCWKTAHSMTFFKAISMDTKELSLKI